ncbi:MAG TPA: coproporphyrinogen III oxidase family protein [Dehalococcoidia bacterium]|jgi:coproporphyrinogen III oxidase-like Fe-S oxidoreductase|nr:coproporphyrinogen III oxidase family protein [Dehalococcoidia bacterium]
MLAKLAGFVTRREGRKFLELRPEIDEAVLAELGAKQGEEISLYIHIPFCRTLCPFCCFNRYLFKEDKARRYFEHLKKEVDLYIQRGFRFSEFYFGGGTPTILMDELLSLIDYLKANFEVKRISLETTPRELTRENIASLKAAGINRLSIGVQSFDDGLVRAMGRPFCTGEETKEKLLMAEGEFDTVNVDLLFNFPSQSLEQFEADVAIFKELGIDQATFYPLMASPHKKNALERRFNRIDTSRERRFYQVILRELYAGGYEASTVWCFSRGNRMIDEYIIDYDDYIGVGAGSVSMVNGNFYVNSFSLERYGEFLKQDKLPIVGWRKLSERENLRYYLLTKLFGMEVDRTKFSRRFQADIEEKLGRELGLLKLFGLVKMGEKIRVTEKGMYPVSVMMREFFAALNGLREYCIENQI